MSFAPFCQGCLLNLEVGELVGWIIVEALPLCMCVYFIFFGCYLPASSRFVFHPLNPPPIPTKNSYSRLKVRGELRFCWLFRLLASVCLLDGTSRFALDILFNNVEMKPAIRFFLIMKYFEFHFYVCYRNPYSRKFAPYNLYNYFRSFWNLWQSFAYFMCI